MKTSFVFMAVVCMASAAASPAMARGLQNPQTGTSDGSAQTTGQPPATQPSPDYILYDMFFRHAKAMDQVAAKQEADGESGDDFRNLDWKRSGLTEDEGATMKQIAYDCLRELDDLSQQMRARILAAGGDPDCRCTHSAPAGSVAPPYESRRQIIEDHIALLKVRLGDESFAKLDHYVRGLLGYSGTNRLAPHPLPLPKPIPNTPTNPIPLAKQNDSSIPESSGGRN
jgi:hypothetical protein